MKIFYWLCVVLLISMSVLGHPHDPPVTCEEKCADDSCPCKDACVMADGGTDPDCDYLCAETRWSCEAKCGDNGS